MVERTVQLWEVLPMPKRQQAGAIDDGLPPFRPKIKRPAKSSREGKQVQAFLSPEEDEKLEHLVGGSQMSKKDYLRRLCQVRHSATASTQREPRARWNERRASREEGRLTRAADRSPPSGGLFEIGGQTIPPAQPPVGRDE